MTNATFVERVKAIAATSPTYRTGGDGSDGTCDCIGLVMGAMGKEYPLHSTNYFARFEMQTLDSLLDESQLHAGSIVYKSRRSTDQLNERYQPGGRYFTGDMLDYYHVGVVTSIDPLVITHCTSTDDVDGIDYDTTIAGWSYFGDLLDVADCSEENDTTVRNQSATVVADSGFTVNMRKRPDKAAPVLTQVPIGSVVQVQENANGWSTIIYNGVRGYMMAQFLEKTQHQPSEPATDEVSITLPYEAAEALFYALKGVIM